MRVSGTADAVQRLAERVVSVADRPSQILEGDDEREPWQRTEEETRQVAFARLYARSVIEVMVVYADAAE